MSSGKSAKGTGKPREQARNEERASGGCDKHRKKRDNAMTKKWIGSKRKGPRGRRRRDPGQEATSARPPEATI